MKGAEKRRQEIVEKYVGNTGKRVFVVEGESDQDAFNVLAEKRFREEFVKKWVIVPARGKPLVLGLLEKEPDWIGLVDKDEWTQDTIDEKKGMLPNLSVLPRFCLENYLIAPSEIWQALPEIQKSKIPGGLEQLQTQFLQDVEKWIRHGVLRTVIAPLVDGLFALGFHSDLLNFDNSQDDEKIREILEKWHDFLDPDTLVKTFEERLDQVREKPVSEQLSRWIYGKAFFNTHVYNVLNQLLGYEHKEDRINDLFNGMALPEDLEPLWEKFGLQK